MARRTNRQLRSVGNLGDVLKHAALFELASMLAKAHPKVAYVDTHTFLLHAPFADVARWNRDVVGLTSAFPAYERYADLERASLARTTRYRCSAGLVIDVLGDRRGRATLGEIDGFTRAELRAQIAEEDHLDVTVADDAVGALDVAAGAGAGAVLVHVDPFSLTPELWRTLAPQLDSLSRQAAEMVLVVYRYTRGGPTAWPASPGILAGPIAHTRDGPHELAVYASSEAYEATRDVCVALGWRLGAA